MEKIRNILPYIIIIFVVLFVKLFIVTPIKVNGVSMMPTLKEKDIMLLDKTAYYFNKPKRFDIVVVNMPNEYLIKRVIGLPGEHIKYVNNILYVDDKEVYEYFTHEVTEDFDINELGSTVIPNNTYLVLGDNRTNSLDSRKLGFIKEEQLMGKTDLVLFPFNRLGGVR